jgi:microcystin-dependent protein
LSDISRNMGLELPNGTDSVKRAVLRQNFESIDAQTLLKAGDTMTGPLILSGNPTTDLGAATKQYVDCLLELLDPLGHVKAYFGTILPARHLWANGCTIGDVSSGATGRADGDTIDLYTVLWNAANASGSKIQLYTSAGVSSTKGASAAADFAAHKRLSLPDMRGRVGVGLDSMGGIPANVVLNSYADISGGTGGEENHVLTIPEMPSHNHSITTLGGGAYAQPGWDGPLASGGNGLYPTFNTNYVGGNGAHNNMQPWIACNYIMRY